MVAPDASNVEEVVVIVTAESEDEHFTWEERGVPVTMQLKKIAEKWALAHGVPDSSVGFEDAQGRELDLSKTIGKLNLVVGNEPVRIAAFPVDDAFAEGNEMEGATSAAQTTDPLALAKAADTGCSVEALPTSCTVDRVSVETTMPEVEVAPPAAQNTNGVSDTTDALDTSEATPAQKRSNNDAADGTDGPETPAHKRPKSVTKPEISEKLEKSIAALTETAAEMPKQSMPQSSEPESLPLKMPSKPAAAPKVKATAKAGAQSKIASPAPLDAVADPSPGTEKTLPKKDKEKPSPGNDGPVPSGNDAIEYNQTNPKRDGSIAFTRYEKYKIAKTVTEALKLGAVKGDIAHDFKHGFMKRQ